MEYGNLFFLKNLCLKNEQHPLFPTVGNDHRGRDESKSETIYFPNNQVFDVVDTQNLYFIIHESKINSFEAISRLEGIK
jgi:hypothetical protein